MPEYREGKTCRKCDGNGPFYKSKDRKDGLQVYCVNCLTAYRKKIQPHLNKKQNERRVKNRDQYLAREREWRKINQEKNATRRRERYEQDTTSRNKSSQVYDGRPVECSLWQDE